MHHSSTLEHSINRLRSVPECEVVQLVVHDEGVAAPAHDGGDLRGVLVLPGLLALLFRALGDHAYMTSTVFVFRDGTGLHLLPPPSGLYKFNLLLNLNNGKGGHTNAKSFVDVICRMVPV